ncbi:hypothetical protein [Bordetella sp. BOR01]|uniref:hypothetical protein n=1 Tax=Bordetella sp. BOR01 TaxID=2854779 RepID=UPI001C43B68E|nr:hypothetical protein [Bordetella sp. BOR01]MBV7485534.1 hypothetical protein [Bordetella sp. BOR01]
MNSLSSRPWAALAASLLLCLLTACGSGSDDDDSSSQPETPENPGPSAQLRCAP